MPSLQKIVPHFWYDKQAKEAAEFYVSIFPSSKINYVSTITDTPSGDCDVVEFELCGQTFQAISAGPLFKFNESVSFVVRCEDQAEIDFYWQKLSADPKSEQCGWVKDKFGLSWQIVPRALDEMLLTKDPKARARVVQAFLKMKKFDLAKLEQAFRG